MTYTIYDFIGNIGVAVILITYLLLQIGRLDAKKLAYSIANGLGAGMIVISLMYDWNLSAFIVEAAWVIISLIGVVNYYRARSAP